MKKRVSLPLASALWACAGQPQGQGEGPEPMSRLDLQLHLASPSSGAVSGGEPVTLQGQGFSEGSELFLDGYPCESQTLLSSVELSCVTPDLSAEGSSSRRAEFVLIRLEDGQDARLDFELIASDGGEGGGEDSGVEDTGGGALPLESVDYCHIQWPCSLQSTVGEETELIYTWVYEAGATEGTGQGEEITVELGLGEDGASEMDEFDWVETEYHTDKDGLTAGDLANDEYAGALMPEQAGSFDVCARVSADSGRSWTICDLGGDSCGGEGSTDGYSPGASLPLTVEDASR